MMTPHKTLMTLACLAILATAAVAQPGAGRQNRFQDDVLGQERGPRSEMRLERMKQHLELTDAQVTAIEAIHEQARADGRELRKSVARLQNERQGEMLKDDPSAEALTVIIEKMGDLRTRLQINRMQTRLAVRELLTEEQQDKMMAMRGQDGLRGKRGRRGGRDGHGRARCW